MEYQCNELKCKKYESQRYISLAKQYTFIELCVSYNEYLDKEVSGHFLAL